MNDEKPLEVVTMPSTIKQLGDPRREAEPGWMLIPPPPDVCSQCAVDHDPDIPHNQQSLYWQYAFRAEHDRWPTWKDAMAHCAPEVQAQWIDALREHGVEVEEP